MSLLLVADNDVREDAALCCRKDTKHAIIHPQLGTTSLRILLTNSAKTKLNKLQLWARPLDVSNFLVDFD